MENAVKALIMVAGLIVGVLIIGLLVYLFRLGGNVGGNYEQSMSEGEIASFNAKFEPYMTTLKLNQNVEVASSQYKNLLEQPSNNINDIVSVINMAYDINAKTQSDNNDDGIAIIVNISGSEKYYMDASKLYGYYRSTLSSSEKKRKKNIVFNASGGVVELNGLMQRFSNSCLYSGIFNERLYEYYFDCTQTEYSVRGRLKKMVFSVVDFKNVINNSSLSQDIKNKIIFN